MTAALQGGFAHPSFDAARAFRGALDAMAHPGRLVALTGARPPAPISSAAGALLLTLCDADTPLWMAPAAASPDALGWIAFHTGAPVVADRGAAAFALGGWPDLAPLAAFPTGAPDHPDRSTTLILELDGLEPGGARLSGPGVAGAASLALPLRLIAERAALPPFPHGLDLFLTAGETAAALPRSTRIEVPCTSR